MGHVHSKRKKQKYNKELADYINRNIPGYDAFQRKHSLSPAEIEHLSKACEPFYSQHCSSASTKPKWVTMPITHDSRESSPLLQNVSKGHISYKDIKVDGHPALLNLQNEQNIRLEKMEERMNKIRQHAMQEADRRKYAYLFKAKSRHSPTKELLKKTKDKILQKTSVCDEKENQKLTVDKQDTGEVIPVKTVTPTEKSNTEIEKSSIASTMPAFDRINLNDPKSVLLLPFLLPIFLLLYMVRTIAQSEKWRKDRSKQN